MDIYHLVQNLRARIEGEADRIALNNGFGGSEDLSNYKFRAGRATGLMDASKIIADVLTQLADQDAKN